MRLALVTMTLAVLIGIVWETREHPTNRALRTKIREVGHGITDNFFLIARAVPRAVEPYLLAFSLRWKIRRTLKLGSAEHAARPRGIAVRTSRRQLDRLGGEIVEDACQRAFGRTRSPWAGRLPNLELSLGAGAYGWVPEVWLTYEGDSPPPALPASMARGPRVMTELTGNVNGPPEATAYLESTLDRKKFWLQHTATTLIGRSALCDVVLKDPRVSKQHARIWCDGSTWWLEREASTTNPLLVNDNPVEGRTAIRSGQTVGFGRNVTFRFVEAVVKDDNPEPTVVEHPDLADRTRIGDGNETQLSRSSIPTNAATPSSGTAPGASTTSEGTKSSQTEAPARVPQSEPSIVRQPAAAKPARLRVLDVCEALTQATPAGWPDLPKGWIISVCDPSVITPGDVHRLWDARNKAAHASSGRVKHQRILEAAAIADRLVAHLAAQGIQLDIYETLAPEED